MVKVSFLGIVTAILIIVIKAENEKVEKGNVTEIRCQRLKASFAGIFLKCIRELIQ